MLVLSQYVENRYAAELLGGTAAEASATCSRTGSRRSSEFLDALNASPRAAPAFDPEVVRQLARAHHPHRPAEPAHAREREVLATWPRATPTPPIAERLHVSQSAVEKHINAIFDKLELSGTSPATAAACWPSCAISAPEARQSNPASFATRNPTSTAAKMQKITSRRR